MSVILQTDWEKFSNEITFPKIYLNEYTSEGGGGTAVAQWFPSCCATNRKVAGSIPDSVIGIFHCHVPSDRTMALGSNQPLTEISTRGIFWG